MIKLNTSIGLEVIVTKVKSNSGGCHSNCRGVHICMNIIVAERQVWGIFTLVACIPQLSIDYISLVTETNAF